MTTATPEQDSDQPPAQTPDEPPLMAARLTYRGRTYVFAESTADNVELIAVEDLTGWATGEWLERLNAGSIRAITALVWLLVRREQPTLAFPDVKFTLAEIRLEFLQGDEAREAIEGKAPSPAS